MNLKKYTEEVFDKSFYNPTGKEKFLPWYFELFGIQEELFELEEEYTEKSNNLDKVLLELGDVFFYTLRFSKNFEKYDIVVIQEEINRGKTQEELDIIKSKSFKEYIYLCRKMAGKLSGYTKKHLRVGQVPIEDTLIFSCIDGLLINLYYITIVLNSDLNVLLKIMIEKLERRSKKLEEEVKQKNSVEKNKREKKK